MSTTTPRPRDRTGTETAIVEAARRLLLRDGWTALNIQALAAEAGVDRKLIYRYFTDLDGVVERLAGRADIWLGQALAERPPSTATTYRAFVRESVLAYLHVLRTQPLVLRMLAWEMAQDTPLLRRLEAARSRVMQDWMAARRPGLAIPSDGDAVALNVVLLAAVQHLALAGEARGRFAGVELDDRGWARIEAAIDRLIPVWPD
ncbi:TetR/AcrR family transcriptional regulator [Brevundimonas sp. SH203]|uniref:TetR/AcrR family transcriptional regulator n=1 Tax=Brevundimonas sp. SH203 TaxID=345167 RepID=UPI00135641A7|nr:TetR/AcrR family transcriptional regulator [Brevundimonas sp. SH203]